MTGTPDVPAHLYDRPEIGGLVVPWITPSIHGVPLFGQLTDLAVAVCLTENRCQICGHPLPDRAVLFARDSDLDYRCTPEPATCPPCATYSARACPMLAGDLDRYRTGPHPAFADASPTPSELARRGAPAEAWHAVWVADYDVITHPAQPGVRAASWARIPPLRIRPVPRRPRDGRG
ncbi:hypothetical protein [Cryptosporangium minutisporangium]|uniref:Uncharacterized protein n=1 Tax=Cryptosporangium minutisporangium TaxID=113569 RepID=A0ABP6SV11_9ACTN